MGNITLSSRQGESVTALSLQKPKIRRSISRETTLDTDSIDPLFLESTLSYLTEKSAAQLRSSRLFAKTVTLKLRYSDFKTVTRSQILGWPTAADHTLY